ncbi:hypothetical protein Taro_010239 [Colocasia esculenta]|uniref:Uncharacterized protein n=1 Tax=Colocasia esculenta TaxID=4460 RepID=A0A843TYE3_COLES|nr:hypothetical protein [Colocasia esculenta]
MVKQAQLLEDATDFMDRNKGRIVKKEQAHSSSSRPTNGKKRPLSVTDGPNQERKPKIATPSTPNKTNCKHYDKPGHTVEKRWRKASTCLCCGSHEHHILDCPKLNENDKHPGGQRRQGRLQAMQETETTEDGGVVEGTLQGSCGGALGGWGAVDRPQEAHLLPPFHLLRPVQTDLLESTKGGRDSRPYYRAAQGRRDPMKGVHHPRHDFDVDPSTARVGLRARLGVCANLNHGRSPGRRILSTFRLPRNSGVPRTLGSLMVIACVMLVDPRSRFALTPV